MTYRSEAQKEHRRKMQHERYMRNRESILAQQKEYRETHRDEIRERHRAWRCKRTVEKLRQFYSKT